LNGLSAGNYVAGVVLAGGKSLRMKIGFKPLLPLGGRPVIDYVIKTAAPQVKQLSINANTRLDEFKRFGLTVYSDVTAHCNGPLLGIYSAMDWYRHQSRTPEYLASFPADVPFFPPTLIGNLQLGLQSSGTEVAWCRHRKQDQPLFALWSMALFPEIKRAVEDGLGGPRHLFQTLPNTCIEIETIEPGDFLNINEPGDLITAERLLNERAKVDRGHFFS